MIWQILFIWWALGFLCYSVLNFLLYAFKRQNKAGTRLQFWLDFFWPISIPLELICLPFRHQILKWVDEKSKGK